MVHRCQIKNDQDSGSAGRADTTRAQKDDAEQIHDNSGVNQYAQRIISTPVKQDGLVWQNPDGSWGGPVGSGANIGGGHANTLA